MATDQSIGLTGFDVKVKEDACAVREVVLPRKATAPDEDVETFSEIFRAFRALTMEADKLLLRRGLGRAHFRALHVIATEPGGTVSGTAGTLGVSLQAMTRVMNDLSARELIRFESDADDKRKRRVFTTDEGQAVFREIFKAQTDVLRRATALAGPDAFAGYRAFMRAIIDKAQPT